MLFTSLFSIEAAYRFYKFKCEESARHSGKAESKKASRRRHEQITRVSTLKYVLVIACVQQGKCVL